MGMIGYVYGIICPIDRDIRYIGVTTKSPSYRLTLHKRKYKVKLRKNLRLSNKEMWFKRCDDLGLYEELTAIELDTMKGTDRLGLIHQLYEEEKHMIKSHPEYSLYNSNCGGSGLMKSDLTNSSVGLPIISCDVSNKTITEHQSITKASIDITGKPNSMGDIRHHLRNGTLYKNRYGFYCSLDEVNWDKLISKIKSKKKPQKPKDRKIRVINRNPNNKGGNVTRSNYSNKVWSYDGSEVKCFESRTECALHFNTFTSTISRNMKNKVPYKNNIIFLEHEPHEPHNLLEEYRNNMKSKILSGSNKASSKNRIKVMLSDINTGVIIEYESIKECAKHIGSKPDTIRKYKKSGNIFRKQYKIYG